MIREGALLSWDGQTLPIHGKSIPLLSLHVGLLFSLLNCLDPNPGVPSLLLFSLSPHPDARGARSGSMGLHYLSRDETRGIPKYFHTDCNEKFLAKT